MHVEHRHLRLTSSTWLTACAKPAFERNLLPSSASYMSRRSPKIIRKRTKHLQLGRSKVTPSPNISLISSKDAPSDTDQLASHVRPSVSLSEKPS
jgi:hypothetical protein